MRRSQNQVLIAADSFAQVSQKIRKQL